MQIVYHFMLVYWLCSIYGDQISVKELVASYVHLCTLYWWLRPFGCGVFLGGYGRDGPQLYMIEPSGVSYGSFIQRSNRKNSRAIIFSSCIQLFRNTSRLW